MHTSAQITLLGPMPPLKAISAYMRGLVGGLSHLMFVQVLSFRDMYPRRWYPGGSFRDDRQHVVHGEHVSIDARIDRRNPYSWIRAGMAIEGKVLHTQYRIRFLAPVTITICLVARWIKRIPVILTVHNVVPHEQARWKRLIDRAVIACADHYVVHAPPNKQQLLRRVDDAHTISIIPHGVIDPIIQKPPKLQARKLIDIDQDKKVLLFVGNIRPYKGLALLLEAMVWLRAQDRSYHLIIAGACREDRTIYQKQIDRLHLGDALTRIDGYLDDEQVAMVFGASDLLVLPYTHFDAQSGVLARGLGYEMPMVVTDLGGLTTVIDNPDYVTRPDPHVLAETIHAVDLLDARRYIQERKKHYDRSTIAHKYHDLYTSVGGGPTHS